MSDVMDFKILSMRPLIPPQKMSWGGLVVADFAIRHGYITIWQVRLIRAADGEYILSLAFGMGKQRLAADPIFRDAVKHAAVAMFEAATAHLAPADPPLARATPLARANPDEPSRTEAPPV